MKIAVPIEGKNLKIIKRTGEAPCFAIFDDGRLEKIVKAPQDHDHKSHDDEHMQAHGKSLENIADCDIILVQAIGPHMKDALEQANIAVKKIRQKDGEFASETVANFLATL